MNIPSCLWPFTSVAINHEGEVFLCPCVQWTSMGAIGNVHHDDLETIWNSGAAHRYRKIFLEGKAASICDVNACAYLQNYDAVLAEKKYLVPINEKAMARDEGFLPALFTRVKMDTDWRCNLRCKMCRKEAITKARNDTTAVTIQRLRTLWTQVIEYHPATSGEPLFIPEIRELLASPLLAESGVQVELVTNASLFTEAMWERIGHNRFSFVKVSLDAVSKDVYESIRIGSDFDRLMQNLRLLTRLKREGRVERIQYTIVVMRSNYKQLPQFVDFAESMTVDAVKLLVLNGDVAPEEYLTISDEEALRKILQLPEMRKPIVNLWGFRRFAEEIG